MTAVAALLGVGVAAPYVAENATGAAYFGTSVGTLALGALAQGTAASVLATWFDRCGLNPDRTVNAVRDWMRRGHLPLNHDIQAAVTLAVARAAQVCIGRFRESLTGRGDQAIREGATTDAIGRKAQRLFRSDVALTPDQIGQALRIVLDALPSTAGVAEGRAEASSGGGQMGGDKTVGDIVVETLLDGLAPAETDPLAARLRDQFNRPSDGFVPVLVQFVQEALKTDDRLFRIVAVAKLAEHSADLRAMDESLQAFRDEFKDWSSRLQDGGLGDQVEGFRRDLSQHLEGVRRIIREEQEKQFAPTLEWFAEEDAAAGGTRYFDRSTAFVGRKGALEALGRFVEGPEPLAWAVVNGAPGSGKNRLLIEAFRVAQAAGGLDVGFVGRDSDWIRGRFERWTAQRPAVLFIDYAQDRVGEIRRLIANLKGRQPGQQLGSRVRLILLDTLPWDSQFGVRTQLDDGTDPGEICRRAEWTSGREALNLDLLSPDEALLVAADFAGGLDPDAARSAVAAFAEDEELRRPLFAMLAGEAAQAKVHPLTVSSVSRDYLRRQRAQWARRGVTGAELGVVAVATAGAGCRFDALDELGLGRRLLPDARRRVAAVLARPVPAGGESQDVIPKMEPDFVGGLFVLQQVSTDPARLVDESAGVPPLKAEPGAVDRVMGCAWRHGTGPTEFLRNLAQNFSGDPALVELVGECCAHVPDGERRDEWFSVAPTLAFSMAASGADATADRLLCVLRSEEADAAGRSAYARALFASGLTVELGVHPRAANRLQELRDLAARHKNDDEIRNWLAMGLFNAFFYAAPERAEGLLQVLRDLAAQHKGDADVGKYLAMGLFNAFLDAAPERAESLLQELRDLAAQYKGDAEVGKWLAKGLSNAIAKAAPELVETLLQELRDLAAQHKGDADVRENLASGLFNAFSKAAPERAESLLQELRDLAAEHKGDADVRKLLAMGLFNAFLKAAPERAEGLLQELRDLAAQHSDDGFVAEVLQRAGARKLSGRPRPSR